MPQIDAVRELYNLDAERAVLSSIIIDPPSLYQVSDFLKPSHFQLELHRWTFEEMLRLSERDEVIDLVVLEERLSRRKGQPDVGWFLWLSQLLNDVPTAYNIVAHGKIVEEHFLRRRMKDVASKIATLAHQDGDINEQIGEAEVELFNLREGRSAQGVLSPRDYVQESLEHIEERRFMDRSKMLGIPTGFLSVDKILDGLVAPFPYILAGRPGMGKSSMAIQIAVYNAFRGRVVQYFTPEMTAKQLAHRIYSMETNLPLWAVRHGRYQTGESITDEHMAEIYAIAAKLDESKLFIDPTPGITPGQIRAKAMRCYAEHGVDLIVVDHLHEMQPDKHLSGRHLELGDMMRSLKEVGKLVNAPILILAQLSRALESKSDKRPQLSDLRESGAIEEVAYGVMFLYRQAYYDDLANEKEAECIIAKNRDGELGTAYLEWDGPRTAFSDPMAEAKGPEFSQNGSHNTRPG